jgi:hypothetical protein
MFYVSNFRQILGSLQYIFFCKELIISNEQHLDMLTMTNQKHEWNNILDNWVCKCQTCLNLYEELQNIQEDDCYSP